MSLFSNEKTTEIWDKYQNGVDHHNALDMYAETERNFNFYYGDQWKGVFKTSKQRELPKKNFIKPTIRYKTAMVAMNKTAIIFSGMDKSEATAALAKALTEYAGKQWERSKMDTVSWEIIKRGSIAGDCYLYAYVENPPDSVTGGEPTIKHRIINNTSIYFADEQNPNVDEQEYIIISERLPVSQVRKIAKQYKVEGVENITSDEETDTQLCEKKESEVKGGLGKCTSLLFMRKTDKGIEFCRSVKSVIYQPATTISLDAYPVAPLRWETRVGSARGISGVEGMIANQIMVNETLWRTGKTIQELAYPKIAYDADKVLKPSEITNVGATIAIQNMGANPVSNLIDYLEPPQISSIATTFAKDLADDTQKLEGAGDAATGQVNPENASGEAIKAARDQAAIPLNEPTQNYKQFVEDLALIWFKLLSAYAVNGITVEIDNRSVTIPAESLQSITPNLKVDISPVDPFSVVSQEISIDRLFSSPLIQNTPLLKEYAAILDDTSTVPKSKLEMLIKLREEAEQAQMEAQAAMQTGGMPNEMQY